MGNSAAQEVLPMRFAPLNVIGAGVRVRDFKNAELEVLCVAVPLSREEIFQLGVAAVTGRGICAPPAPDSFSACGAAHVEFASVLIRDHVYACNVRQR